MIHTIFTGKGKLNLQSKIGTESRKIEIERECGTFINFKKLWHVIMIFGGNLRIKS